MGATKAKLLVIEQNLSQRVTLERYLSKVSFEVTSAETLQQWCPRVNGRDFDLVLLSVDHGVGQFAELAQRIRAQFPAGSIPILFLWPAGSDIDTAGQLPKQTAAIRKPAPHSELLDVVHSLLGDEPFASRGQQGPADQWGDPSLLAGETEILLVEDSPLNRLVVENLLQKLGLTVSHATDGLQAVETVKNRATDIVLMDCQLPRMDGVEATREIRAWERAMGRSSDDQVWIIALTADDLMSNRDACLAAGMNDHITKPIQLSKLHDALARALSCEARRTKSQVSQQTPGLAVAWGDTAFARPSDQTAKPEVISTFMQGVQEDLNGLTTAQRNGDLERVRFFGHRLKGGFAMFQLYDLSEICERIESFARAGRSEPMDDLLLDLETTHQRMVASLTAWSRRNTATSVNGNPG